MYFNTCPHRPQIPAVSYGSRTHRQNPAPGVSLFKVWGGEVCSGRSRAGLWLYPSETCDRGPVMTSLGFRDLISKMGIILSKSLSWASLGTRQVTEHSAWSPAQRKGPQHCCPASQTARRAPWAPGSLQVGRRLAGEADTRDPDVIPKGETVLVS